MQTSRWQRRSSPARIDRAPGCRRFACLVTVLALSPSERIVKRQVGTRPRGCFPCLALRDREGGISAAVDILGKKAVLNFRNGSR